MALDAKLKKAMKAGYWKRWNGKIQKQIDENIEKYRKADADWKIEGLKAGTDVKVEQVSHKFIFGAHIFNFDQLGTDERNEKYKA
ncbi:MAG: 1,4-beta-xylanase, partial [Lentisphaeria bacterium]|nr:1,4-beta-xylanase [Lentisphaeria bacterium]